MNLNKVFVVLGVVTLITAVFVGVGYIYQYTGFNRYIRVMGDINKMLEPGKTKVSTDFYGDRSDTHMYNGILAGVNKKNNGGIWVWGRLGLLYLPAEKESRFAFIDVCSFDQVIKYTPEGVDNKIKVPYYDPEVFPNIQQWSEKVKVGNFVEVLSKTDVGFLKGNLGAVFAYNGRYLLTDLKTTCE